jgi:hypothetical protein
MSSEHKNERQTDKEELLMQQQSFELDSSDIWELISFFELLDKWDRERKQQ